MHRTVNDVIELKAKADDVLYWIKYFEGELIDESGLPDATSRRLMNQLEYEHDLMIKLAESWQARITGAELCFQINDSFVTMGQVTEDMPLQAIELLSSTIHKSEKLH